MPQGYFDLLYLALFLVVLIAIYRLKASASAADKPALGRIVIGMICLTIISILQTLDHQMMLESVPLIGDPSGLKTVMAIGIMTGLAFLLTGVGAWLPSWGGNRKRQTDLGKRYFCLKMVQQAVDRSRSFDEALAETANCLMAYMKLSRCVGFKYSAARGMLYAAKSSEDSEAVPAQWKSISLSGTRLNRELRRWRAWRTATERSEELYFGIYTPDMIVPITHKQTLYGAIFAWGETSENTDDDMIDLLTTIGEILGRHATALVAAAKGDYQHNRLEAVEEFSQQCQQASGVKDIIGHMCRMIQRMVGAEYLSFSALDSSGENMIRHTIGSAGRLLLEKGISRPTQGSEIYRIYREGAPRVTVDVAVDEMGGVEDGLFLSCGMHARLSLPVLAGKRVMAVVTLGHSRTGHFTPRHSVALQSLIGMVAGVVAREQLIRRLDIKENQIVQLETAERNLADNGSEPDQLDSICRLVTEHMNSTIARVSLLDGDRSHLVSQACRSIRPLSGELKHDAVIPLSLLPWHRMALDAKKLMLINQEDPESRMLVPEASASLVPDLKSAVLVPILVNDNPVGLLSIGEQRNWNRRSLGATDLIFAKNMAGKCAVALRMGASPVRTRSISDATRESIVTQPRIRQQISDPLSSIIGAVELLKRRHDGDDYTTKYHDLILRSAERIKVTAEAKEVESFGLEPAGSERFLG